MRGSLTICAALRIEARAALAARSAANHSAGGSPTVLRIGMRARRPRVGPGSGPVALIGFGGGLDPSAQVGDVVVASEVATSDLGVIQCRDSAVLAELLTRAGFRVHLAPIVSSERIVHGQARRRMALSTGAAAVDMESAPLGREIGDRSFAVVRVIVDTATKRLIRLSMVSDGTKAYRTLRGVARVLPSWAEIVGSETSTIVQQKVS